MLNNIGEIKGKTGDLERAFFAVILRARPKLSSPLARLRSLGRRIIGRVEKIGIVLDAACGRARTILEDR